MERLPRGKGKRRTVLKSIATLSAVGVAGLAGCTGDDGNGNGNGADTIPGSDYPAVDEWMTETDVGDAANNYDGEIMDLREESDVSIDVGAGDDGLAYGPSAVAVSSGTEVLWEWTGEGGAHNIEAEPDDQIGESDYEFSSGEAVDGADNEYSHTFDESGIALYHCEPHLSLGMKGSIVID
ncbi:halocyanin domain-containing protein [Natronomonas amylolytica]|uniref:halocyanin domain-containing protein n=1 Tax=Natronomonas amylolytica TaxID=3108498 RepID=UPI00300AB04E